MTTIASYELPDIDLSPLERALGQFEVALRAWAAAPSDDLIRDAVIQRFEFPYELSIKMLRRYLRSAAASDDEVNELTFRELIRRASDLKLVHGDVFTWLEFRQARTDTVPTYNEIRAVEVAAAATTFAGGSSYAARSIEGEDSDMIDPLQLGLSEPDLLCIMQILGTHVADRPVYAFGSRASGHARRRSDLDLAIGGTTPLSLRQRALLHEGFDESDLPIKVDIVDSNAITPEFHRRIERDFVVLQESVVPGEVLAR